MQNQGPDVSRRRRKPNGQFDNELLPRGDNVELGNTDSSEISSMVSKYGFTPEEANKWIQYDFTAEEAWRWGLTHAFSPKDAHDWKEQQFDPDSAASWRNAGIISAGEAARWDTYHFKPDEARGWRLNFSTNDALKWSYYGFTADQANHWRAAGFSDHLEASKWNGKYPGAPWRARIDKEDLLALEDEAAGNWEDAGFTAEEANDWVDEAGIEDVDEAPDGVMLGLRLKMHTNISAQVYTMQMKQLS